MSVFFFLAAECFAFIISGYGQSKIGLLCFFFLIQTGDRQLQINNNLQAVQSKVTVKTPVFAFAV